jgi:hypothetical protein
MDTITESIEMRHVCGDCCPGYMRDASPANPAKTDWCVICRHRSAGIDRDVVSDRHGVFSLFEDSAAGRGEG